MTETIEQLQSRGSVENFLFDELTLSRNLTEVEHLNRLRNHDGSHNLQALEGVKKNLIPAVKEASIPHAISTTYQPFENDDFYWLDMTAEEAAASGYKFHNHSAARARVEIEIEEAKGFRELQPGWVQVFISPKMSECDAPYKVAQHEHLADDDMLRIHSLDIDQGVIKGKFMQSLLLRHVPLEAWIAMLKDPNNIFGKPISIDNTQSALSVMKVHKELRLPIEKLPEGVISLVETIEPYLEPLNRQAVHDQLELLRSDQATIHHKAENIATRWLAFETELADSLFDGYATPYVRSFLKSIELELDDNMIAFIDNNTNFFGELIVNREMASLIEQLRRNTLWTSAAVVTGNQRVIEQLSPSAYNRIYNDEMFIQQMLGEGVSQQEVQIIEAGNNRQIAEANIKVGGGCPGLLDGLFKNKKHESEKSNETEVLKCVKCPLCGKDGVDAHIKHNKEQKQKIITCSKCKQSKIYKT